MSRLTLSWKLFFLSYCAKAIRGDIFHLNDSNYVMHPFVNNCQFKPSRNENVSIEFETVLSTPGVPAQVVLKNAENYAVHVMILEDKQHLENCGYDVPTLHEMIRNEGLHLCISGSRDVWNIRALVDELRRRHQSRISPDPEPQRSLQDPRRLSPSDLSGERGDAISTPLMPQVPSIGDIFQLNFDRREDEMPSSRSEPTLDILHSPSSDPNQGSNQSLLLSLRRIQCDDRDSTNKPHIFALIPLDREAMNMIHFTVCDLVLSHRSHDSDRGDHSSDQHSEQHSDDRSEIVDSSSIESSFESDINEITDQTPTGIVSLCDFHTFCRFLNDSKSTRCFVTFVFCRNSRLEIVAFRGGIVDVYGHCDSRIDLVLAP